MKCLVTGQSGLIGSHLVEKLLSQGHEVFGISRTDRNFNPNCHNFLSDLRDTKRAKEIIESISPEIVFALAANAAEGKSFFSPIDITSNNINVFLNTLVPSIRAGNLKRFVFTSSIAVYGEIPTPFEETDIPIPQDVYGISKLSNERILEVMSKVHGFEFVIIRPHNVFGPRQNMTDPYRNVVTLFMNHLLKNQQYSIYGNGEMKRCFSYVKEVVDIICRSGFENVSGMTFNVGSDIVWSINQLSELVQKISGIKIEPKYLPIRTLEVRDAIADHSLINKYFGYVDTPLENALQQTWTWAKEQGPKDYVYTELELPSEKVPVNWKHG